MLSTSNFNLAYEADEILNLFQFKLSIVFLRQIRGNRQREGRACCLSLGVLCNHSW